MSKSLLFLSAVAFTGVFLCIPIQEDKILTAEVEGRTLVVTLENNTHKDLIFWELGNMWGDGSFYLIFQDRKTNKVVISRYGHTVYPRHIPATQVIREGTKAEFRIDLDDTAWSNTKIMRDGRGKLKSVILSSGIDEFAISSGVFLDRLYFHFPIKE